MTAPRAALVIGCALAFFVCTSRGAAARQQGASVPAGTPQAPVLPTPSSSGALRGATGWLDLANKTRGRATDAPGSPKGWKFLFEAPAACTGCPDRVGPPVTNANALWRTSGTVAWHVGAGVIGVRLTGQRGARLPLFTSASGSATAVPMASDVILSDPRTQWTITLSAERIVLASRGRTLSVFGDLVLPLGSIGRAPTTVDVRTPAQTALIGGVRIRSK